MEDKNIIIGVTDLELTTKTLPNMVEWLRKLSGRLRVTLLYVEDACGTEAAIPVLEDIRAKDAELMKLAKEFEIYGIPARTRVKVGVPADEIIREARSKGAFAILMSALARSGISRVLFSSVVEDVIRRSPCPVVVFKPRLLRFTERIGVALSSRINKLRGSATLNER
jgi:nucleotide-binding universal stress UspA family protein